MLPLLGLALHAALFAHWGQWTHRYPKVAGFNHHVYLERYDLPVLNPGPSDPLPGRRDRLALDGQLPLRAHRSTLDRKSGKPRPRCGPHVRRELLALLDVAGERLEEGYEGSAIPALEERFAEARHKLEALSR